MIVTVLYPAHEGARFDGAYYAATHAKLAQDIWNPEAIMLVEGVDGPGGPAPYRLVAHFHFASGEAMGAALASPRMAELAADVPNFTDIAPVIMFGKPLE